ncbi:uncharacterized protein LOC111022195 isoform X2 [Momordica charantia]|uniref:Uncharacterized protein LOC111022195 isoform X2 n=1 Tax=Momordica charantia TaxID=3673 RepID=A0A6J1DLZ4_MOMCH|nr:uncharacterized protein LOC111022195 isoform X2 [Momordica charantia]
MTPKWGFPPSVAPRPARMPMAAKCEGVGLGGVFSDGNCGGFPSFLPKEVAKIKDPFARTMARKIQRLPITLSETRILSSCVEPLMRSEKHPVVLLHCFDSSCLEWSYTFPLLEEAGLETWAVDVLGWGFSDLDSLPPCNVQTKCAHLYQFWKSYIKRSMVLVGPSLGAAVVLDFAANHPEAVEKLVLINACVYSKCTGHPTKLPKMVAYAGVGRLHCLLPWWEDATVNFMNSGGYNVTSQIKQVKQRALIIAGEDDRIIPYKDAVRLHCELPNAIMRTITDSGHLPHVDSPASVSKLITDFVLRDSC